MPLANGEVFAGYRIERLLGSGGMGEIYLARHPRLPRYDALKILAPETAADAVFRERFIREADLAANLYHPNIVGLHDRGEFEGRLWISMDFIDGTDAGRLLVESYAGGMPVALALEIISAVADALDYAHASGLLHRDVKPANILVTAPRVGKRRILLADFGIARSIIENSSLTKATAAVGTANYCAPEQLLGRTLDGRTDQYALAATAFHLLTGALPFDDSNLAVVIGRHLNVAPPALSRYRPELAGLDAVMATAMAKTPEGRFRTCAGFAGAMVSASRAATPLPGAPRHPGVGAPPAAASAASAATAGERVPPPTPPRHKPATKVMATPVPPTPAPVYAPTSRPPARWPIVVGVLAAVITVAAVVLAAWQPWQRQSASVNPNATPTVSSTPDDGSITLGEMSDSVTAFYGHLPTDTTSAWSMLHSAYQQKTGRASFVSFWATIRSVTVLSVSPRNDTSVVARLRYVLHSGRTDTEDRWLSFVRSGDGLLVYDSERIGPAS